MKSISFPFAYLANFFASNLEYIDTECIGDYEVTVSEDVVSSVERSVSFTLARAVSDIEDVPADFSRSRHIPYDPDSYLYNE